MAGSDGWTDRRRDEFVGSLKTKPGLRRYLRRTNTGLLRIDAAAIKRDVVNSAPGWGLASGSDDGPAVIAFRARTSAMPPPLVARECGERPRKEGRRECPPAEALQ